MIIAIDFDGTIVEHRYPKIGPPVPHAIHWMKEFQQAGARLILWTMRSDSKEEGDFLKEAVDYCRQAGIEFWGINGNPEQHEWTQSPKAYAHMYIDDAAFGCPLIYPDGKQRPYVDWAHIGPFVMERLK